MPLRDQELGGYSQGTVLRQEPRPAPGLLDTISDAFYMENDVLNAWEKMNQPVFKGDPEYQLGEKLKTTGMWEQRDDFLGVQSDAEFDFRANQIHTENERRQRLGEAGWPGIVAQIGAGALSPTMFLPLIGPGLKGAKAVGYAASLAALGAGAQEGVLLTSQQTRTTGEAVFSVAASTVLGGLLGGAVSMLRAGEFDRIAGDIETPRERSYTPVTSTRGESVGSAASQIESAGGLAPGLGNKLAFTNPVTRLIQQVRSPVARAFVHMFSDAGMTLEGAERGVAAQPGGNVESLIKTYAVYDYKGIQHLDANYSDYMLVPEGAVRNLRTNLSRLTEKGKLSRKEFNEEVTKTIWSGQPHSIPEVNKAAKALKEDVYDPLLREAQEVGLLPEEVDLKGDLGYTRRMFDTRVISAKKNEFIDLLTKHYEKRLNDEFMEKFAKFSERAARDAELLTDLGRSKDEVAAMRQDFLNELEEVDAAVPEHLQFVEDDIAMLQAQLRRIPDSPERGGAEMSPRELRESIKREIEQLEARGGEGLLTKKKAKRELERRLRNLSQSRVAMAGKQAAKQAKLERIDEITQNTLNRAVRVAGRFLKLLDRTSGPKLQKEISKLKTAFAQAGEVYDRGEEELTKLFKDEINEQPTEFTGKNIVTVYHGSREPIEQFDPTQTRLDRGVFFSEDPTLASNFAIGRAVDNDAIATADDPEFADIIGALMDDAGAKKLRADHKRLMKMIKGKTKWSKTADKLYAELMETAKDFSSMVHDVGFGEEGLTYAAPNVTKTRIALGKTYEYKFKKGFDWDEEANAIKHAKDNGFDSVTFIIDDGVRSKEKFYSVFDAKNIDQKTSLKSKAELALEQKQRRTAKMDELSAKLEDAENFDQADWQNAINDLINESMERAQSITLRRGARAKALQKEVEGLDPKLVDERIKRIVARSAERKASFADFYRERMGTSVDLDTGVANFNQYAHDLAEDTTNGILKINDRIQFNDLIREERGPEMARMLNIPSMEMADFLEKDSERLLRLYVKTMGSDIPIARVTGSANAAEKFQDLEVEHNSHIDAIAKAVDKEGKPLSKEAKEKLQAREVKDYRSRREDMITLLERARRSRGIPDNPDGMMERMAGLAMSLNTARFMGGVVIASVADVGRTVQKFGLTRVFRDGFGAMIRDLKTARMSQREAQLAGVALDVLIHSRAQAISDITDSFGRGTKVERGAQYLANKMGVVAGFDYWTSAWKQFTAGIVNAELLESVSKIMEGGSAADIAKAQRRLASVNLTPDIVQTIWEQVQRGGGAKHNGVWLPQSELWDVADPAVRYAQRAYRAALAKMVDDTIITPGMERPSIADKHIGWKMLFQFKSFAMSSTTKTLMAGLQEKNTNYALGTTISLGLGALSYYLWAVAVGGDSYEKMLKGDLDDWADEAITRSGQTGGFDIPLSLAQRTPALAPFTSFSGARSSRRQGGDLAEALLGPTYNLLLKGTGVLMGIDDPTQNTLHQLRQMLPLQNHFLLRQIFDAIEASSGLPTRRTQ